MTAGFKGTILTIAGSDSLGGGGLQSDLVTFSEYGFGGLSAITSIATVFSDHFDVHPLATDVLADQLASISQVKNLRAIKVGLIPNLDQLDQIAAFLAKQDLPIVIDPVLAFKEGQTQQQEDLVSAYRTKLLPLATVVTPNLPEAEALTQQQGLDSVEKLGEAAKELVALGAKTAVVKGGARLPGEKAQDAYFDQGQVQILTSPKFDQTAFTNGAGCTFSAAITANLAAGYSVEESLTDAKDFVNAAIWAGFPLGDNLPGGDVWPAGRRTSQQK
ncbi:hydroxymethylpyrimidine/phosphomethylpyrimidine kinase [Leuconostocaceae bacterium ESL0723]|nr:hydroxymethylpyrimidine/phosphomethylpyrimidine kinase [Leuconostocaceae bacterium ESL0723]